MRILLVEDDLFTVEAVTTSLKVLHRGVDLVKSLTLKEAERKLTEERFDVVLLDLGLPDSSGVQTLTHLRTVRLDVPIVVFTGTEDDETRKKSIEAGAVDFVMKSRLTPESLLDSLLYAVEEGNRKKNFNDGALRVLKGFETVKERSLKFA